VTVVLASFLLGSSRHACAQDDATNAKQLLDAVAAGMKDAPAIAFESELRTKIEKLKLSQKAKVLLQRPNLSRVEISGVGQDALIVLDGTMSWHYLKARNGFVKSQQLGTLKLQQYGAGPIAILFFEKSPETLLPYLADATVSREKLGADDCSVIAWKVGTEESRVWICGGRLRRSATVRMVDGNRFEQTIDYGAIDFAPAIPDGAFTFAPPSGAKQLPAGDESKLLAVGADAPDFAATHLDGKPLKLSDFKGKPVLVSFWFYACATCREEFRRLQKLHGEYSKRGVTIVAMNFGDTPDVIGTYFWKEGFAFTPAIQKDKDVSTAFGVEAYPTNYVIGPDGKVAFRATGFDETSLRAALEKLAPSR
jgi:peroxiredoxin/outer membrane lipoprotein-sorting protein